MAERTIEHESNSDTKCSPCARYNNQMIDKRPGRRGNIRTNGDHPVYSIIKIGQDSEKRPGYLRRISVTQIPVEDHEPTLVRKTLKRV